MCGRFALFATVAELVAAFGDAAPPDGYVPSWNVAPGRPVLALARTARGTVWERPGWGLVPAFAKRPDEGPRPINARAETLAGKPAFRGAFRRGRVAVPMNGFYEWRREGRARTPWFFSAPDGLPFAVAAIRDAWRGPDGAALSTCAIVTTAANARVAPVHGRMPAILDAAGLAAWLDPSSDPAGLPPFLAPCPAERLLARPVPPLVNAAGNDGPALVGPADVQALLGGPAR